MRLLIIDIENSFYEHISKIKEECSFTLISEIDKNSAISLIAEKIDNTKEQYDAFLINIDAEFENAPRYKHKGIELVFWLRLKYNIGKPIILVSFRKITKILKDYPLYTILSAKRVFFEDILSEFNILNTLDVLKPNSLSKNEIRKYYIQHAKNVFDISLIRHQEANWFAIKTLWDINKIKYGKKIEDDYPDFVKKNLHSFNNFIASWLYPTPNLRLFELIENVKIERAIKSKELIKQKELISSIPAKISFNIEMIELYNNEINEKEGWISSLKAQEQREGISKIEQDIKSINQEIENISKENVKLKEQLKTIKEIELSESAVINSLLNDLGIKKTKKRNINLNILHIDDLAHQGWAELFIKILKGSSVDSVDFKNIVADSHREKIDILWERIRDKINNKEYQAIILDLRLFSDDNSSININDISGMVILERIKETYIGIPVLITSASNKIWTYKTCLSKGADAYWIKEGVDNNYDIKDSIRSYDRLINIINSFKNNEYVCLREMKNTLTIIEDDNKLKWWNNNNWEVEKVLIKGKERKINNYTKVFNKDVSILYKQVIELYAIFLRKKNILNNLPYNYQDFYYSSMITHLGKIIEIFHPPLKDISTFHLASLRGDSQGKKIYYNRNLSSHYGGFIDTNKFINFIRIFNRYIINEKVNISKKTKDKSKKIDIIQSEILQKQLRGLDQTKKEQKKVKKDKTKVLKPIQKTIEKPLQMPKEKVEDNVSKKSFIKWIINWIKKILK